MLFSTTAAGDLTAFLKGYFDTTTGSKIQSESYEKIAVAFGIEAREILFVSDVTRELDAARLAGLQTALCLRPGNHTQPEGTHPIIHSFEEIEV